MVTDTPAILVVGGTGYFGTLLIRELLRYTDYRIIVGGRNERRLRQLCDDLGRASRSRVSFEVVHLADEESVNRAVAPVSVAICAAGPYQELPTTLVSSCLEHTVHYIDLADDREFVARVRRLVAQRSRDGKMPAICTGWSAIPALSGLLTRIIADDLSDVDSIEVQIAPGNRAPRGLGTVSSLLSSVGKPFDIWRDGSWQKVQGWSQPRVFDFPSPVGRRVGYLVNAPDYDILPATFGARTVAFRVGSEIRILNTMVSGLALLSRRGVVRDWSRWAAPLRLGMAVSGLVGHDTGSVGVRVCGRRAGIRTAIRACVVADHVGQGIPVMPAVLMTMALIADRVPKTGLLPVDTWLTRGQLESECRRRSYRLVVEDTPAA